MAEESSVAWNDAIFSSHTCEIPVLSTFRDIMEVNGVEFDFNEQVKKTFRNHKGVEQSLSKTVSNSLVHTIEIANKRPRYVCKYVTGSKINILQDRYPQFTVVQGVIHSDNEHPFARESRALDALWMYDYVIRYDNHTAVRAGYDYLVKDVGGQPSYHDGKKHSNVHICFPSLDFKDKIRNAAWDKYVARNAASALLNPSAHPVVAYKDRCVCNQISQFCPVKAPIVTFIHSTYNMTLYDIGAILDKADAVEAYMVFVYDPTIEIGHQGEIPEYDLTWKKYKDAFTGEERISFAFATDNGAIYHHKYEDYINLTRTLQLATPAGNLFLFDVYRVNQTMRIHLIKTKDDLARETIFRKVRFTDPDYIYIGTWSYDVDDLKRKLTPIFVRAPKDYVDKCKDFACDLPSQKFTLQAVSVYCHARNNNVTVRGRLINGGKLSPYEVEIIANYVYLWAYKLKFANSQTMRALIDDETAVRTLKSKNRFTRALMLIFARMHKTQHPSIRQEYKFTKENGFGVDKPDDGWVDKIWNFFIDVVTKNGERSYREFQCVEYGYMELTFEELIDTNLAYASSPDLPYVHPPSVENIIDSDKAKYYREIENFVADNPVATRYVEKITKFDSYHDGKNELWGQSAVCNGEWKKGTVQGEGECFFHSVNQLLDLNVSPAVIRRRLRESHWLYVLFARKRENAKDGFNYVVDLEKVDKCRHRLGDGANRLSTDKWADESVIALFAQVYNVCVCLHSAGRHRRFNTEAYVNSTDSFCSGTIIHLQLENKHFSPLLEQMDDVEMSTHEAYDGVSIEESFFVDHDESYSDNGTYPDHRVYQRQDTPEAIYAAVLAPPPKIVDDEKEKKDEPPLRREHVDFADRYNIHSVCAGYDKYGFEDYYPTVLHSAFNACEIDFKRPDKYLNIDIRRNSSSHYLFTRTKFQVTRVSVASQKVIPMIANSESPVISLGKNRDRDYDFTDLFSREYDHITINPAYFVDRLKFVNTKKHDQHVYHLRGAITTLKFGGNLFICLPEPLSHFSAALFEWCGQNFRKVCYNRCKIIPQYLPWVFLCALGFTKKTIDKKIDWREHLYDFPSPYSTDPSDASKVIIDPDNPVGRLSNNFAYNLESASLTTCREMLSEIKFIKKGRYIQPSNIYKSKLREFMAYKPLESLGGFDDTVPVYDPPTVEPSLSEEVYSPAWVRNKFQSEIRNMFDPRVFKQICKAINEDYRDRFIKKFKLENFRHDHPGMANRLAEILIEPPTVVPRDDEITFDAFERKYALIFYHECHHSKNPLVDLNLNTKTVFKRLSSTSFYTHAKVMKASLSALMQATFGSPSITTSVVKKTMPSSIYNDPTVKAMASRYQADTCTFKIVNPSSSLVTAESIVDIASTDDGSDNSLGGGSLDDSKKKEIWLDHNYGTVETRHRVYFNEYKTHINCLREKQEADTFSIFRSCIAYVEKYSVDNGITSLNRLKKNTIEGALKNILTKDFHADAYLKINGNVLYGDKKNTIGRRYQLAFKYDKAKRMPDPVFKKVDNPNDERCQDKEKNIFSINSMTVFMEQDISEVLRAIRLPGNDYVPPSVTMVQGVPGCGKTEDILNHLLQDTTTSLAVMKNSDNVDSAKERLRIKYREQKLPLPKNFDDLIISIDKLIISQIGNTSLFSRRTAKYDNLRFFVDEACTHLPGKIITLLYLFSPRFVSMYGDLFQIGFIDRTNYDKERAYIDMINLRNQDDLIDYGAVNKKLIFTQVSLAFPVSRVMRVSYRMPVDVCYVLSPIYADLIRKLLKMNGQDIQSDRHAIVSMSNVVHSMSVEDKRYLAPAVNVQYLTYTQSDKADLESMFADKPMLPVKTIHEYQGNQHTTVHAVRLSEHERYDVPGGIYQSQMHRTALLSRHTKKFVYITVKTDDYTSSFITSGLRDFRLDYDRGFVNSSY